MATHFARWTPSSTWPAISRLDEESFNEAHGLSGRSRTRFLASRTLLAELMFMLYGIKKLPKITTSTAGRPHFEDASLADFSLAYAGQSVGVMLTTEGRCGLEMALPHSFGPPPIALTPLFSRNEAAWINNQKDPYEASIQLRTLRQSVLKLTGSEDIPQLIPSAGRLRVRSQKEIESLSDVEDILIWACTASPFIGKLTLWEFDVHLGWRNLRDIQSRLSDPDGRIIRFTSQPYEKDPLSQPALYRTS